MSRRAFLAGFPALQVGRATGKGQQFSPELKRYADSLTEREVWRLTSPSSVHYLPYTYQKFTSQKNSFLLLAGQREGEIHALRMELPSGRMVQLSQGPGVAPYSICLAQDERSFFFIQNGTLKQMGLRTLKEREIHSVEDGWVTGDLGISVDGRYAAWIEMRQVDRVTERIPEERVRLQFEKKPLCRIRVIETLKGKNWIVAEEKAWLGRPQLRPKRDQVLYRQTGPIGKVASPLWLVNLDGKQKQSLRPRQTDQEEVGPEYWTDDGKLIGYVHYLDQNLRKATVRTLNPDTREEQVLSRCTQFWNLMGNTDNSAIAGESRSKAGPNIYVLFPLTEREITVCEHGSTRKTEEAEPRVAFSPDSQWIYFTSDREGMPAIYRAGVADWVEKTD